MSLFADTLRCGITGRGFAKGQKKCLLHILCGRHFLFNLACRSFLRLQRLLSDGLVFVFVGQIHDGQLAVDGSVERDDALAARQSEGLQLVVDDVKQVVVVYSLYLYEHIEASSGVVTLHHLWYFLQCFYYRVKVFWVF